MAPGKSRANLKRNATNSNPSASTSSNSTKRPRRGSKDDKEDAGQTHLTSSPGSSNMKLDKVPPRREPRQAAVASMKKTKAEVAEPSDNDDEGDLDDDQDFEDNKSGQESDNGSIDDEEGTDDDDDDDDDDDFEDDFRGKRRRGKSLRATAKQQPSSTSSKTVKTPSLTISKPSASAKRKQDPAAMTAAQKAAHAKALSKFKVSTLKIPHPKGGPVADAIQPETLEFIRDLKLNNDREYMMLNQERCDKAKADFIDFIRMVKDSLREADPDVLDQEPKDSMLRIYRDVRFSNDKSPYKSQLAAHFSRGGRKSIAAGYFFSVSSQNNSFVGCGVWDSSSAVLARIRNGIVEEEERFRAILESDAIKEIKQGKTGADALLQGNKLKTGPKGFDKDHSAIEFLKLKNFAIGRHFTDLEVVSPGFLEEVFKTFDACVEFVHILNEWIG